MGYLDDQADQDRLAEAAVRELSNEALSTLIGAMRPSDGLWPYELASIPREQQAKRFSASTQTMILHAIATSAGLIEDSVLVPSLDMVAPPQEMLRSAKKALSRGVSVLLHELDVALETWHRENAPSKDGHEQYVPKITISSTWGHDDPLTLTWLTELLTASDRVEVSEDPGRREAFQTLIRARASELVASAAAYDPGPLLARPADSRRREPHAFVLLRAVQLARAAKIEIPKSESDVIVSRFRNVMNAELARSSVTDGGFDPASLVFALEGLTELQFETVEIPVLDRAMEVLGAEKEVADHWRPVHPITSTPQGLILLPQSIEVANSFLRLARKWEERRGIPLFSRNVSMLRSYADWIQASSIRVQIGEREFLGWQSEHTYEPGTIHLWATSQSVLFLEHFSGMLNAHIAREARDSASLDFSPYVPIATQDRIAAWKSEQTHEPLLGLGDGEYMVYPKADSLFVAPRNEPQGRPYYSLLLYGPPGTGKTQFARALANVLEYDFISISPSDFTRSGESGVEARAQQLFKVLELQSRCVVLFDEIDRLLLDRSSDEYIGQSDMFQFMTPSMLTKLNDLRTAQRCIFVIATNYEERIDGAIKRPGRVDTRLVLMPPDLAQRRQIVDSLCKRARLSLDETHLDLVASKTALFVFKEIDELVAELDRAGLEHGDVPTWIEDRVTLNPPTITLEAYRSRFVDKEGAVRKDLASTPWLEFCLLGYLKCEVGENRFDTWMQEVFAAAAPRLRPSVEHALKPYMKR